jgi:hypothetical protein
MPRVVHLEIHAADPGRSAEFYQTLFGWQIVSWEGPVEYRLITTGPDDQPGINGGLIVRRGPARGRRVTHGLRPLHAMGVDPADAGPRPRPVANGDLDDRPFHGRIVAEDPLQRDSRRDHGAQPVEVDRAPARPRPPAVAKVTSREAVRGGMRSIMVVALLAACGGVDAGGRWTGTMETLPGGAVRVTNPSRGVWESGRPWRLEPALVLGQENGPEATVFGAISGLEVDAAGRIYVLDRQANELRIFTRDGAHVRSVGREGGGPGEYSNANGLRWLAPDTLVVVDQRANRYTILTAEGAYVRTVPRGLGFYRWVLAGGVDGGSIYERWYLGAEGQERLALVGVPLQEHDVPLEPDSARGGGGDVLLAGARDTVLLPPMPGSLYEAFSVRTDRGGMSMGVPFAPEPVFHVDGRGSIWHGHGSEFRILRTSLAGDTIAEILLDVAPVPVTAAELAEWEAGPSVKQFRDMGGRLDLERIPKVKPYFDDLYVDPDGHLWVSVPAAPMEAMFRVFDPDGRYLGMVRATGFERYPYVPIVVRGGLLYLVGRDELDVQRVYVFDVERERGE